MNFELYSDRASFILHDCVMYVITVRKKAQRKNRFSFKNLVFFLVKAVPSSKNCKGLCILATLSGNSKVLHKKNWKLVGIFCESKYISVMEILAKADFNETIMICMKNIGKGGN